MTGPDRIDRNHHLPPSQTTNVKSVGELQPGDTQRTVVRQVDQSLKQMEQRNFELNAQEQSLPVGVPGAKDLPLPAPKNSPVMYASEAQSMEMLSTGKTGSQQATTETLTAQGGGGTPQGGKGTPQGGGGGVPNWWPPSAENIFATIFSANYQSAVAMQAYVTTAWSSVINMNSNLNQLGAIASDAAEAVGNAEATQITADITQAWVSTGLAAAGTIVSVAGLVGEGSNMASGMRSSAQSAENVNVSNVKQADDVDEINMRNLNAQGKATNTANKEIAPESRFQNQQIKDEQEELAVRQANYREKYGRNYEEDENNPDATIKGQRTNFKKEMDQEQAQYQKQKLTGRRMLGGAKNRQEFSDNLKKFQSAGMVRRGWMAFKEGVAASPGQFTMNMGQLVFGQGGQGGMAGAIGQAVTAVPKVEAAKMKGEATSVQQQESAMQQVTANYAGKTESTVQTEQQTVTGRIHSINEMINAITQGLSSLFH